MMETRLVSIVRSLTGQSLIFGQFEHVNHNYASCSTGKRVNFFFKLIVQSFLL
jgi:hypothetical protein